MTEEKNLPAIPEEDFGKGFEEMEGQDFAFPFLVICQANSPYLKPESPVYIEDAKQGFIINQQNNNVYKEVNVIPCKYTFRYVEWKPRATGGGFVASYKRDACPKDISVDAMSGKTMRSNGNELMATSYYLCLLQEESFDKVIIPMTSTQLKKARKWNSLMVSLKNGNGQSLPMFNKIYTLSVVSESNSKGSWYGWKIEFADNNTVFEISQELYSAAKEVSSLDAFLPETLIKQIAHTEAEEQTAF